MALHPNRYNRTSEAYDFTLFEGKEPKTCANDLMLRELKKEF